MHERRLTNLNRYSGYQFHKTLAYIGRFEANVRSRIVWCTVECVSAINKICYGVPTGLRQKRKTGTKSFQGTSRLPHLLCWINYKTLGKVYINRPPLFCSAAAQFTAECYNNLILWKKGPCKSINERNSKLKMIQGGLMNTIFIRWRRCIRLRPILQQTIKPNLTGAKMQTEILG